MFIRKWRYEQNMAQAREKGYREGIRVANDRKIAYLDYLEQENKTLQDTLAAVRQELTGCKVDSIGVAAKMAEDAKKQMDRGLIAALAEEIACYQKMADVAYYTKGNKDESSCLLDKALALKEVASKMGICADVYERAYQIYDFRNSGKKGYTLKDGKIVKVEQEEAVLECPFVEEPVVETGMGDSTCDEITVCCPEVSGTPDSREDCCEVQGFCDEESFF